MVDMTGDPQAVRELVEEIAGKPSKDETLALILEKVERIEQWQAQCNELVGLWAAKVAEFEQSPMGQMLMGQVEGILG